MIPGTTIAPPDRTTRTVKYLPHPIPGPEAFELAEGESAPAPFFASYLGPPPAPLTECWFSDDGNLCFGPMAGPPELLQHDDFFRVPTTTAGTSIQCDEQWRITLQTASSLSQIGGAAGMLGAAQVIANGAANRFTILEKDEGALSYANGALWFSSLLLAGSSLVNYHVGLRNDAASAYAMVFFQAGVFDTWTLLSTNDAGVNIAAAASPVAPLRNQLDVLLSPGEFCALWVDFDGPYFNTTNIPLTTQSGQPFFLVQTQDASPKAIDPDWVRTLRVPAVVSPATLPLPS